MSRIIHLNMYYCTDFISGFIVDKKLFATNIKIRFNSYPLNSRTLLCESSKPVQNDVSKNSVGFQTGNVPKNPGRTATP